MVDLETGPDGLMPLLENANPEARTARVKAKNTVGDEDTEMEEWIDSLDIPNKNNWKRAWRTERDVVLQSSPVSTRLVYALFWGAMIWCALMLTNVVYNMGTVERYYFNPFYTSAGVERDLVQATTCLLDQTSSERVFGARFENVHCGHMSTVDAKPSKWAVARFVAQSLVLRVIPHLLSRSLQAVSILARVCALYFAMKCLNGFELKEKRRRFTQKVKFEHEMMRKRKLQVVKGAEEIACHCDDPEQAGSEQQQLNETLFDFDQRLLLVPPCIGVMGLLMMQCLYIPRPSGLGQCFYDSTIMASAYLLVGTVGLGFFFLLVKLCVRFIMSASRCLAIYCWPNKSRSKPFRVNIKLAVFVACFISLWGLIVLSIGFFHRAEGQCMSEINKCLCNDLPECIAKSKLLLWRKNHQAWLDSTRD